MKGRGFKTGRQQDTVAVNDIGAIGLVAGLADRLGKTGLVSLSEQGYVDEASRDDGKRYRPL